MNITKPLETGDMYRCEKCSLEIHITKGCDCEGRCADLECCGQPMEFVTEPEVENRPAIDNAT